MDSATKEILTNRMLIGIQQDARGNRPFLFKLWGNEELPVIVRYLGNGDIALGFFNLTDGPAHMWVTTEDLGVPETAGKKLSGTEAYSGRKAESQNGVVMATLAAHACEVYRFKVVGA